MPKNKSAKIKKKKKEKLLEVEKFSEKKENSEWEEINDFGGIPKDVEFKRNMGCGG